MKDRWTPVEDYIARYMFDQGEKICVIAATLKRSDSSVSTRIYRLRLKPRGKCIKVWTRAMIAQLLSLRAAGKKNREIAQIIGVHYLVVNSKIQKLRRRDASLVPYRYNVKREAA